MTDSYRTVRQALLEVRDLEVSFPLRGGLAKAVNGVDFTIHRGETLGLVGESGCGKSVTSLAVMGLVPAPGQVRGRVLFHGDDLLTYRHKAMRRVRGNRIAMIFQDPMTALNPVFSIGDQLAEPLRLHRNLNKADASDRAAELLAEVGLPEPGRLLGRYPHELSGGQRQRVVIAMALSCEPDLLIADEPTTALDVTIQAQILELMADLQEKYRTGILLITHDLGVIAEIAQRVAVMYAGNVVETAPVTELFDNPKHPYTRGLLASVPTLDHHDAARLQQIPGSVPGLLELPPGCRFQNRCELAVPACAEALPTLRGGGGHAWRCREVH